MTKYDTSSKGADRPKRGSNRQYLRMLAAYTSNMDALKENCDVTHRARHEGCGFRAGKHFNPF